MGWGGTVLGCDRCDGVGRHGHDMSVGLLPVWWGEEARTRHECRAATGVVGWGGTDTT